MKNAILLSSLCMMLCGCGEDAPPTKPGSSYTPPDYKKSEPALVSPSQPVQAAPATQAAPVQTAKPATTAAPAANTGGTGRPGTQILNDAAAVVDYGTGATPLNVKKKQTDKIQAIQNKYNQGTNKAINDK